MPTCPNGHSNSGATAFCTECGAKIGPTAAPAVAVKQRPSRPAGAARSKAMLIGTGVAGVALLVIIIAVVAIATGGKGKSSANRSVVLPPSGAQTRTVNAPPAQQQATQPPVVASQAPIITAATAPPTTAATEAPSGTVLYQSDWSQGMGNWAGGKGWKLVNGMLVNDGTGDGSLVVAPYRPAGGDIAIEVEARVTRVNSGSLCVALVGLGARDHYSGKIGDKCTPTAEILRDDDKLAGQRFDPTDQWHTYRFLVQGNVLRFSVDGAPLVDTTDTRYLTGGRIGFFCGEFVECEVRSFQVIKP